MSIATLRHPGFRAYYLGSLTTVHALWMLRVALAWLAWDLSGSAGFVGFVAGLAMVPSLVTGPIFGVLVDRTEIIRAAWWTAGALSLSVAIVFLVLVADGLGPVVLAAVALVVGVVTSAHHPVRMSLGPRLVPAEMVSGVVALGAVNFNVARLIAPVLAGALIAGWGVAAALIVTLLFTLPMLLILPRLDPRPLAARTAEGVLQGFRAGVVYAARSPVVRAAILLMGVFTFAGRGALEILPVFADGVFERGASGLGLMTGAAGAGALVAAVSLAALPARVWRGGAAIPVPVLGSLILGQAAVLALGLVESWPMALAWVALLGFASTLAGVSLQTVVQSGLDDALRGRIMSLWIMTGFGFAAVGAAALGAMIDVVGRSAALPAIALVGGLLILWLIWRTRAGLALSPETAK